jgi:hypothetical protein
MDDAKCQALKEQLAAQPEPQIVSVTKFFDGNDDLGSIGCNLDPHPGIDAFRGVLTGLLSRPDVKAVYAQISELDPGDESWPFTDTVLVAARFRPTICAKLSVHCSRMRWETRRHLEFQFPSPTDTALLS